MLLLTALSLALAWPPVRAASAPPVLHLTQAEFARGDAPTPPAAGWQPQTLPDSWRDSRPDYTGFGWYRIGFRLEHVPDQPLMLYVPRVSLAGEIRLNGALLIPDVRFDTPARRGVQMSDSPLFLSLPSALFRPGDNEFLVRLQGDRDILSGLSAFSLGRRAALSGAWSVRDLVQGKLPSALLILSVCIVCYMVAYMRLRRGVTLGQLTGLAALLTVMCYGVIPLPGTRAEVELVRAMTTTCLFWWLNLAGWRLAEGRGRVYPWLLHGLSVATLLSLAALRLLGDPDDALWLLTWPHQLLGLPVIALLLARAWQRRSFRLLATGLAGALWLAALVHAKLIAIGWAPWDAIRFNRAGALPLCVVTLYLLIERFILDREEAARAQRAAVSAERGRILQDMHDGMGSHLITALRLAQRDAVDRRDVVNAIDDALQDMRLIIDSLDVQGQDLLPLLGNLRFRLEPRLNRLGIRMTWDVAPLPPLAHLTPERALSVLRIVQEAINNALKHSGATRLRIEVKPRDGAVRLRIEDDGRGFDAGPAVTGRGLAGMRRRAEKLGGRLEVESSPDGTAVTLHLPGENR